MKRLFFAPFLLASLFSFGGELKAHPDSRYEIQNTKLNISDPTRLNNNNPKHYLLSGSLLEIGRLKKRDWQLVDSHNFLKELPFQDEMSCKNAIRTLRALVEADQETTRYRFFANCTFAERSDKSKYEIPEWYKFQVDYFTNFNHSRVGQIIPPYPHLPNSPAHFSNSSSCDVNGRRRANQVKGWIVGKFKGRSRYICVKTGNLVGY